MITITNKLYEKWSYVVRRKLRSLSLRGEGDMCKAIAKKSCDTFVAFDEHMIIGWAIYIEEPWYHSEQSGDFMLYIRKSYRKHGIGRMLIQAGLRKYALLRIHPWNIDSGMFFRKMLDEEKDSFIIARGSHYVY